MGCNFYTLDGQHIGKRSAAGYYCFDCNATLCKGGKDRVHDSDYKWYDECPDCRQKPNKESFENSSVGLELGFNNNPLEEKSGVRSCSSFAWAIDPILIKRCKFVKDEYGKEYTIEQFVDMLTKQCPIRFYDMIGENFS